MMRLRDATKTNEDKRRQEFAALFEGRRVKTRQVIDIAPL
jgi:hypothetical protein